MVWFEYSCIFYLFPLAPKGWNNRKRPFTHELTQRFEKCVEHGSLRGELNVYEPKYVFKTQKEALFVSTLNMRTCKCEESLLKFCAFVKADKMPRTPHRFARSLNRNSQKSAWVNSFCSDIHTQNNFISRVRKLQPTSYPILTPNGS